MSALTIIAAVLIALECLSTIVGACQSIDSYDRVTPGAAIALLVANLLEAVAVMVLLHHSDLGWFGWLIAVCFWLSEAYFTARNIMNIGVRKYYTRLRGTVMVLFSVLALAFAAILLFA